jgi:peptidoglycan/LPS O-acetylase OafA/YrhL
VLNFSGQAGWATLVDLGHTAGFGVDQPLWTLTLEIGFYVVLPFVAASYFRRPLVGIAIAAAISILWREAFTHLPEIVRLLDLPMSESRAAALQFGDNQLPHWAFAFGAGMTSAWAYVRLSQTRDRAALERTAPRVLAVGLTTLCVCVYFAGRYVTDTPPAAVVHFAWHSPPLVIAYTASLATVMLALSLGPGRLQRPFCHPRVRLLADISYGVYLIHALLLWVIAAEFAPPKDDSLPTFAILAATVVPLSLAYGYLSTRFVEQPVRRWAQRYGRRAQARQTTEPAAGASRLQG